MKKLVLASALLAAFGAAQAQVSVYGLIDLSYGKSILDDINGDKADFHSGGDNGNSNGNSTTRFGIKGSTEVAKGVKANFALESGGISLDGNVQGGGPFFARQAWAGISSDIGEFRLGRQDTVPFLTMIEYDFNGASNGISAGGWTGAGPWFADSTGSAGRNERNLQYISPSIGGAVFHLGYEPKGNRGAGAKDVLAGAVKYAAGPVSVAAVFQSKLSDARKNFYSVAGSYDLGVAKLAASYKDGGTAASGGTGKGYTFGVNVPVEGLNIGGIYAQNTDSASKGNGLELYVNKEVFKNTYAYAEFGKYKNKVTNNSYDGYAAGFIYTF